MTRRRTILYASIFAFALAGAAFSAKAQQRVLRWGGDAEGGAPFNAEGSTRKRRPSQVTDVPITPRPPR